MKAFFVSILTFGVLAFLTMLFMGTAAARFNLITVHPSFWYFVGGMVFFIGGGFLLANESIAGGFFSAFGSLLLLIGGFKAIWPNTSTASANAQVVVDTEGAKTLNATFGARQIPCDRSTKPNPDFFDRVTGKPIIWVAWDQDAKRFLCFNRPGFHPQTRAELIAVNAQLAADILSQEPPGAEATTALAPTPVPSPTPLPELGTADVTEEDRRSLNKRPVPKG